MSPVNGAFPERRQTYQIVTVLWELGFFFFFVVELGF